MTCGFICQHVKFLNILLIGFFHCIMWDFWKGFNQNLYEGITAVQFHQENDALVKGKFFPKGLRRSH